MKIDINRDGSKWICFTKVLLLFRPYKESRVHFIFWKAPGISKLYGLKNCRFSIHKGVNHKPMSISNLRVFIRLPFFYWNKHNCGWEFGLPNLYLWWHEARVRKEESL